MEQYILLENMRFFSHHGVFRQEQQVGNWFEVTLRIKTDFTAACESDRVEDTVSYADLYDLVAREMKKPSCLLEHVAGRIMNGIRTTWPAISCIEIKLSKLHPPLPGEIEKASVWLSWNKGQQ